MNESTAPFETLKQILRHARDPDLLNDHPWVRSLIVQEALENTPHLAQASPGQQLVSALAGLFPQLQPANPPRCGKRLDPRWGEFGLLAALYFTPFDHGTAFPTTLLEAWARIDPAILYFVYDKPVEALEEGQVKTYRLVGPDVDFASASTLSDWHRKGLQRFAEIVLNRERFLSRNSTQPSIILTPEQASAREPQAHGRISKRWRALWLTLALLFVMALGLGSLKAWRIYESGQLLYQDVTRLQALAQERVEIQTIDKAIPILRTVQNDLSVFKEEARPALWLSPRLGWIPTYGGDLASAPALIELAEHMLGAAILASDAAQPLLEEFQSEDSTLNPHSLTGLLLEARPQMEEAGAELDLALAARKSIAAERLSPRLRSLLVDELDPVFEMGNKGLALARALPEILGAGSGGPKTYLLLAQNEDELRSTGGFITSVGKLVLHDGKVISMEFEGVDTEQEDWSKPYPSAPWQLQEYMNSPVLILRDANWFTDFPTTVQWVEYLYAYKHSHSVDGIIAFDQRFLVMLLGELGPLQMDDLSYPITDQNVIQYMRQSKIPPEGESSLTGWYRKEFIGKMAGVLLEKLSSGEANDWGAIAGVLSQALAERHLLLQFDDPVIAALIAERGWDNAIRPDPEGGDFLMVTDTNIGFNKTNAVVDVSLSYDVDLNDLSLPKSILTVTHKNNAREDVSCSQWDSRQTLGDEWYPIHRCYWNYLRVYKQAGIELIASTPHFIAGERMLLEQDVPPRVDPLSEELPDGQGFGTLLVVPGGESLSTSFTFTLPSTVLFARDDTGQLIYHLKVQKQPGTRGIPITIRIHLPSHAVLNSSSREALVQSNNLLIEAALQTDVELDIAFTMP